MFNGGGRIGKFVGMLPDVAVIVEVVGCGVEWSGGFGIFISIFSNKTFTCSSIRVSILLVIESLLAPPPVADGRPEN
jgi:hypothetical protein